METYFSISYNGSFLFRTDVFLNDDAAALRALTALRAAFGGHLYRIERSDRPSVWTSSDVTAVPAVEAPKAKSAGVPLTELEQRVLDALDGAAGSNCGDFACADEVDLKALGISAKQYGGVLTSLENKKVISKGVTYVNGKERIVQVESDYFRQ